MTRDKFVVRLLDAAGELLAWAEVWAAPRPVGRGHSCPFFPETSPTSFVITRDGVAETITVHWCDLDLARKNAIVGGPIPVSVGQVFRFDWIEPVWLVAGMQDVSLPAVTVSAPVTIDVPIGTLAAKG